MRDTPWVVVLAAGEGSRLRSLTTDAQGRSTPKQFCSLSGERTLLGDTLARAFSIAPRERVVPVVAESHRAWWEGELEGKLRRNTVVQPCNRGTAAGVLLPLVAILDVDPGARVLVLPSDHYVAQEDVLARAAGEALAAVRRRASGIALLGLTPEEAESDYGWILPRPGARRPAPVDRFVEKPPRRVAEELLARGGLWNSFIFAVRARVLFDLFRDRLPRMTRRLRQARREAGERRESALDAAYRALSSRDFSRDVLEGSERSLGVLEVPPCGWTDLGTPDRVRECLQERSPIGHPLPARESGVPVLARACAEPEFILPAGRGPRTRPRRRIPGRATTRRRSAVAS